MISVSVQEQDGKCVFIAPYNPGFPHEARYIGGKYNGKERLWEFDLRDMERVKALARKVYGVDGVTPVNLFTIRIKVERHNNDELWGFGRLIAKRVNRDSQVGLGNGVIVLEGKFKPSGGSAKYPVIGECPGVMLEIRDVPEPLIAEAIFVGGWKVGENLFMSANDDGIDTGTMDAVLRSRGYGA